MEGIQLRPITTDATRPLDARTLTAGEPREAAQRFEALLATMLVKEMRATLNEGFFGTGAAGDVYGGWLDQHVGESLAQRDALHLEGVLKESIERKAKQAEGVQ